MKSLASKRQTLISCQAGENTCASSQQQWCPVQRHPPHCRLRAPMSHHALGVRAEGRLRFCGGGVFGTSNGACHHVLEGRHQARVRVMFCLPRGPVSAESNLHGTLGGMRSAKQFERPNADIRWMCNRSFRERNFKGHVRDACLRLLLQTWLSCQVTHAIDLP